MRSDAVIVGACSVDQHQHSNVCIGCLGYNNNIQHKYSPIAGSFSSHALELSCCDATYLAKRPRSMSANMAFRRHSLHHEVSRPMFIRSIGSATEHASMYGSLSLAWHAFSTRSGYSTGEQKSSLKLVSQQDSPVI